MDPVSDVLRAVRLTGAYFYRVEASGPWTAAAGQSREVAPLVLPDSEHVIPYHILTSGSCLGGRAGEEPVRMSPGDAIVFPHGDPHVMSSVTGRQNVSPPAGVPHRFPRTLVVGPEPRDTGLVCGFLGCDLRPYNPLLASLPGTIHIPCAAAGWLAEFPRKVIVESTAGGIGSETMLTRMAELMFIDVVRHYLERLSPQESGWLAGLKDSIVGPALSKLHKHPAHPWTIGELARDIGTSRSVLSERFTDLVQLPPMLYLTRWRLQLASERLSNSSAKIAAIASQVGYESEAAFSRAFKRETGLSPAAWRTKRSAA
jgi:AraC-like DNA-binding protein